VLSGRPQAAWELHAAAQAAGQAAAVGEAGYTLLQQIADDCYRMGAFYYAVKVGVAACLLGALPWPWPLLLLLLLLVVL
jgi:hypothetical protein